MKVIEQRYQQVFELSGIKLGFVLVVLDPQATTDIDHAHVQLMTPRQGTKQAEDVRSVVIHRLGVEDLGAVVNVDTLDLNIR
ncbi:hypothetical protein D3C77_565840 [compost metagenome]